MVLFFNAKLSWSQNKVALLDDPRISLQMRIDMIRNAQKTLDMATYIYGNDEASSQVIRELILASDRGVQVRLIVDDLNNHVPPSLLAYMIGKGIRIKEFNTFALKKKLNNIQRMHAKIIVADHLKSIIGGRNIVNSYFYVGDQTNFKDREIFIAGRCGNEASRRFEDLWFSALLEEITHAKILNEKKNLSVVKMYLTDLKEMPFLSDSAIKSTLANIRFLNVKHIDIFIDRPHSYKYTEKNTTERLMTLIHNAKSQILIESPYVILQDSIFSALKMAISRGVKVEILTNSMMTSDSWLVLSVYFKERDQLLKMGFHIKEYVAEDEYLHTKMMLFDDDIVYLGSFNMDMLSANINTEVMVEIQDKQVFKAAIKYYMETKSKSGSPIINPLKPTLLENKVTFKSLKKYGIIKILEYTIAPYLRDFL
jgi:putative cardiolipin synthase